MWDFFLKKKAYADTLQIAGDLLIDLDLHVAYTNRLYLVEIK